MIVFKTDAKIKLKEKNHIKLKKIKRKITDRVGRVMKSR